MAPVKKIKCIIKASHESRSLLHLEEQKVSIFYFLNQITAIGAADVSIFAFSVDTQTVLASQTKGFTNALFTTKSLDKHWGKYDTGVEKRELNSYKS